MDKTLKYIRFIVFAVFITMIIGTIGVEAKTCVYDYEFEVSGNNRVRAHAEFDVTAGDSKNMLLQVEKSYTQFIDSDKRIKLKSNGTFIKTETGECPTVYLHPDRASLDWKRDWVGYYATIYANQKDCKNFWFFGCSDSSLHAVEGKLEYKENEAKECTDEEKQNQLKNYNNEILRFYASAENIEPYKIKMMNAITNQTSTATIINNINKVMEDHASSQKNAISAMTDIRMKYHCLDQSTFDIDVDNIQKLHETQGNDLNVYKEQLLNEERARQEASGESPLDIERIQEETNGHLTELQQQVLEIAKKAKELSITELGSIVSPNCSNVLGNVVDIVQQILEWIKIIAPVLLILFGSIDYAKAVIANDNDALKKATNNFIKRAIAAVAIFFLPFIVKLLLNLPGIRDEINMGNDPLCGVSRVVIK